MRSRPRPMHNLTRVNKCICKLPYPARVCSVGTQWEVQSRKQTVYDTYKAAFNIHLPTFQSKWINLLKDPKESFYWKRMASGSNSQSSKQIPKSRKAKDITFNPWPLSETLPDMVRFHQRFDAIKSTIAINIIWSKVLHTRKHAAICPS